jgi:hypothetical protein
MNGDSFRGGAYGFSIDTLIKLGDTKTSNNKSTFLNYLVSVLSQKFKDTLSVAQDLPNVIKSSKINISALNQEIGELVKGMNDLADELKWHEESDHSVDKFYPKMKVY